jgi:hypothetical protein
MPTPDLLVTSLDFAAPQRLSAEELVDHLSTNGNWFEASIGPVRAQHEFLAEYPFMNVEFHGRAGFSMLLFIDERSTGVLAAMRAELSKPSVYVCLGGQVIEKWPRELFLAREATVTVLQHFLSTAAQDPSFEWVRLDRFRRETIHAGGKGLIPLWDKLRADPQFPFAAE